MNDKLYLENYLILLKGTTEVYVHGTIESSNNDIREVLNNSLNEILSSQGNVFEKMKEFGFYETESVSQNEIETTLSKLNSKN